MRKLTRAEEVLIAIIDNGNSASPKEIYKATKIKPNNVSTLVWTLRKRGFLEGLGYNRYGVTEPGKDYLRNEDSMTKSVEAEYGKPVETKTYKMEPPVSEVKEAGSPWEETVPEDDVVSQVVIRRLDAEVVQALKLQAREESRSFESHLRAILNKASGMMGVEKETPNRNVDFQQEYVKLALTLVDSLGRVMNQPKE